MILLDDIKGGKQMAFQIRQCIFTENDCYKKHRKITPIGVMVHSTGANNPNLSRYLAPDDGIIGKNKYNNDWNQPTPGGRQVCVHGFIGKGVDGKVYTYQTLPWDIEGWHSGSGSKGSANRMGYIGFEICEDDLSSASYLKECYEQAAQLTAYLVKTYDISMDNVICHSEGHSRGIASNHGDVMHWFPKHGLSMDTFRARVKEILNGSLKPEPTPEPEPIPSSSYLVKVTVDALNYRSGPGTNYKINGVIRDKGTYTIVEENNGWGRLKSGAGWISLKYTKKVGNVSEPTYKTYTVKKGDTLWGISNEYLGSGSKYKEIMELNGLTSDVIQVGQVLKIPN
jgi:LysM repeat protein